MTKDAWCVIECKQYKDDRPYGGTEVTYRLCKLRTHASGALIVEANMDGPSYPLDIALDVVCHRNSAAASTRGAA